MSFFGIFASVLSGGILFGETLKDSHYASNNREEARQQGRLTYGDGKGNEYLVSTGEKVYTHGGKVYSKKHPTTVLYDMKQDYYSQSNKESIEDAKREGRKRVLLSFQNEDSPNGYSNAWVEVSTMRRFKVHPIVYMNKEIHDWDFAFYKEYFTNDGKRDGDVKITRKEFEELGGYIPYGITPKEYQERQWKEEEKRMKKLRKGL